MARRRGGSPPHSTSRLPPPPPPVNPARNWPEFTFSIGTIPANTVAEARRPPSPSQSYPPPPFLPRCFPHLQPTNPCKRFSTPSGTHMGTARDRRHLSSRHHEWRQQPDWWEAVEVHSSLTLDRINYNALTTTLSAKIPTHLHQSIYKWMID